jgi:hypothetical protein
VVLKKKKMLMEFILDNIYFFGEARKFNIVSGSSERLVWGVSFPHVSVDEEIEETWNRKKG